MRKRDPTAAEFLSTLEARSEFVRRREQQEKDRRAREEESKLEQARLLSELERGGVKVSTVWDLVNERESYKDVVPILVKHLSLPYSRGVKEGIARSLTVRYAGQDAFRCLVEEFRKQNDDSETGLKWVLGNAIAEV